MATCPTCGEEAGDARFCPHDGTPLAHVGQGPASMPNVGDRVDGGRYELTELLGKGGMAVVFAAHARALDRDVALKVLYPRWAEDRKTVTRFAREARAASQIDHDNVVKVYDFGYAPEGFYFLAMERLQGRPLGDLLAAGRIRAGRAMHLLLEIAAGMARAHELGVVHRDLKPDNVMVHRAGGREQITIVDFGLSKIESGDAAITGEGDVIGTPDFMAPEQWLGTTTVDSRADVYSFGVLAYRILAGALPYDGDSLIQKLQQHMYGTPTVLAAHPDAEGLPEGLSDLVMRCMAKAPEERFANMGAVLERLAEIDEAHRERSTQPTQVAAAPGLEAAPAATVMAPVGVAQLGRLELLSEIRRLWRVRQSRLTDAIPRVFGGAVPEGVQALVSNVADLEADLEAAEEEVALTEASLKEAQRAHRAKEAELRAQLVEANLELAVARQALPMGVTNPSARAFDTMALDAAEGDAPIEGTGPQAAHARLRQAEARLAAFVRTDDEAIADAERSFDRALARSRAAEGPLGPLYKELEGLLAEHTGGETTGLTDLAHLDEALGTYRSRLDVLERRRARGE